MGKKLPKQRAGKLADRIIKCDKQFPDCPEVPNEINCKLCPFYKK